ncbi:hypothetical protein BWQ96_02492 [Gracilariopsis chorda]|uniref:Myb-like domain-containing protein n=1 Tax=Gracilariopsis chorda TaxID=448386 RepID=A0A2V3J347_9FLOR|nr:hypothetical protein BWQ96_02492 [Gracilariopsis chorda]|eukprot:PXF47810.1 hypothetical protein BWQ96_02492 [Gracilariopsis chorda]
MMRSAPDPPDSALRPEPPDLAVLAVLAARSQALRAPLPFSEPVSEHAPPPPALDPFSVESLSFFVHAPSATAPSSQGSSSLKRPAPNPSPSNDKSAKTAKRQKRFVSNWTPDMDKIVRKSLAKFGWGCWARIAASGKLPKEYTAKMIANRAKSIGLNKHMFGPAIAQTRTKTHAR